MAQIILDIGSGNTCKNDIDYAKRMVDEVIKVDTKKHEVIFKAQLFDHRPPNVPLKHYVFDRLYRHCRDLGYELTASIFDIESLDFLLPYNPCFVKIANRRDLDWLIGEIPRKYKVYVSVGDSGVYWQLLDDGPDPTPLFCVSEYPAPIEKYPSNVKYISDHTVGLDLWYRNEPEIWEKHYRLSDSTGLDAGPFAITPDELKEIL
jgi:sialic acid synthase SpsE